jgi:hypothetical protein
VGDYIATHRMKAVGELRITPVFWKITIMRPAELKAFSVSNP